MEKERKIDEKAKELYYRGYRLCAWDDYFFGIELFTEALKIQPDYVAALLQRGNAYQFASHHGKEHVDCDKAIADYIALLEIEPDHPKALSCLAYAYFQKGENDKAIAEWKKALLIEPSIALEYMPDEFKADMCLEAVKIRGCNWTHALEFVPKEFKTAQLCMEAVKQNGFALIHFSEDIKTAEIYAEAVKNACVALQYVPEGFKTAEMCLEAVEQNSFVFRYVPVKFKTAALCAEMLKKDSHLIEFVPKNFRTEEICAMVVKKDGYLLRFVPEKFKSAELCIEAVKGNKYAHRFVPKALRDEVMAAINCIKARQ
jgi:tetratricopeptide (TPR) repeat protein